nr:MAG TPA: hypothetical protein [Caudoviricetes sp.]
MLSLVRLIAGFYRFINKYYYLIIFLPLIGVNLFYAFFISIYIFINTKST